MFSSISGYPVIRPPAKPRRVEPVEPPTFDPNRRPPRDHYRPPYPKPPQSPPTLPFPPDNDGNILDIYV